MKSGKKSPDIPESFPKVRIRALRRGEITTSASRVKMTQPELACALKLADGTTPDPAKTIRTYEKGKCSSAYITAALADFYDVSMDYILGLDDYQHIGNKEISEITGLSEKSIEVLRYLKVHGSSRAEGSLCKALNRLQLDTINRLLESANMYTLPTEGVDPEEEIEDHFCFTIFEYIGKYLGIVKSTIRDQEFVTIDNEALPDGMTVNELYQPVLLKRIEKALDVMKEANNGNTKEN